MSAAQKKLSKKRLSTKKVVHIVNLFFLIIVLLPDLWACVVASLTIWVTLDFSTGKTKRHEHVSHLCNRKTTFGQMFRINHVKNKTAIIFFSSQITLQACLPLQWWSAGNYNKENKNIVDAHQIY